MNFAVAEQCVAPRLPEQHIAHQPAVLIWLLSNGKRIPQHNGLMEHVQVLLPEGCLLKRFPIVASCAVNRTRSYVRDVAAEVSILRNKSNGRFSNCWVFRRHIPVI